MKQLKRRKRLQDMMVLEEKDIGKTFYEQSLQDVNLELKPEVFFYNCQVVERVETIPIGKCNMDITQFSR